MKTVLMIYAVVFLLTFSSCKRSDTGGTTTGNPLISFSMAGSSAPTSVAVNNIKFPLFRGLVAQAIALPPPLLKDSTNAAISLNEAWISVKQVEFKSTEYATVGEVSGDSVSFQTPTAVNLIAASLSNFGQARIGASLRRVRMQVSTVDVLAAGAPMGLLNKSFYWQGTVGARSFIFNSTEGYEYDLAGPNGVTLTENSNVLLSVQIANIFRKINMTNVTDGSVINQNTRIAAVNPCPLINASATDIYTCFKDGLKTESNLGKDENNDGELLGDSTVK